MIVQGVMVLWWLMAEWHVSALVCMGHSVGLHGSARVGMGPVVADCGVVGGVVVVADSHHNNTPPAVMVFSVVADGELAGGGEEGGAGAWWCCLLWLIAAQPLLFIEQLASYPSSSIASF